MSPITTGFGQTLEPETPRCKRLSSIGARYIRFGPFEVDVQKEVVSKDGSRIRISGKTFHLLLLLLEQANEIVPREAICKCLWPWGSGASSFNLNMVITRLRKALGDSGFHPNYIETVPRKGYVFVAHREVSDHPSENLASKADHANDSHLNLLAYLASLAAGESRVFSMRRVAGLVLIGIVLGAATMALWTRHVKARLETGRQAQAGRSSRILCLLAARPVVPRRLSELEPAIASRETRGTIDSLFIGVESRMRILPSP